MDSCNDDALSNEKFSYVRSRAILLSTGRSVVVTTTTTSTLFSCVAVVSLLLGLATTTTTNAFSVVPLSSTTMMSSTPRTKRNNFSSLIKSTRAADLLTSSSSSGSVEHFRSYFPFPTSRPRTSTTPTDPNHTNNSGGAMMTNGELYFADYQQPLMKKKKMIQKDTSRTTTTTSTTRATDMTNAQKICLNVAAVFVTTAVVAIVVDPSFRWCTDSYYFQDVTETVLEATMPESTADVVCIVLAESAAGIVAAAITLLVNSVLLLPKETKQTGGMVGTAVANGDFFVARASAGSVLSSLGVSSMAASVAAVAVAALPAGIVKATFAQKAMEERQEEQVLQDELDGRHNNKKKIDLSLGLLNYMPQHIRQEELDAIAETNAKDSLVVEVLFDVIKWLVYAVLCAELEGRILVVDGMAPFPGLESAAFGTISSTAAKVYSDILYAYFGFGGIMKQQEVRSRRLLQWLCTYTKEAVSGATLFGVYELMQIPCKAIVAGFLSGGVEGCTTDIEDMQACLASYSLVNPPTAGPEAEFRSLVTAFASLWHQLPLVGQ